MTAPRARILRSLALVGCWLAALGVAACDDGVGLDGTVVGGPCATSSDCEEGSICLGGEDLRFPGGTCSKRCGQEDPCPGDSLCVRLVPAGVCLLPCSDAADCRDGYQCNLLTNQSGAGSSAVCILRVENPA